MLRTALCAALLALAVGCQADAPAAPRRVVTGPRQAGQIAAAWCQTHHPRWGPPMFIIQQMDGYYVEFVTNVGYQSVSNGLTVRYDGTIDDGQNQQ